MRRNKPPASAGGGRRCRAIDPYRRYVEELRKLTAIEPEELKKIVEQELDMQLVEKKNQLKRLIIMLSSVLTGFFLYVLFLCFLLRFLGF